MNEHPHQRIAYREAGHAIMYCMIVKNSIYGYDVDLNEPEAIKFVTIMPPLQDWDKIKNAGLAYMGIVADILIAGNESEKIHFDSPKGSSDEEILNLETELLKVAYAEIKSSVHEFAHESETVEEMNARSKVIFRRSVYSVRRQIKSVWSVVDKVVYLLYAFEIIPLSKVYELLEDAKS
ncbi:MAG: hypothetical protein AAFV93_25115 [Chloroflexota bacterium]